MPIVPIRTGPLFRQINGLRAKTSPFLKKNAWRLKTSNTTMPYGIRLVVFYIDATGPIVTVTFVTYNPVSQTTMLYLLFVNPCRWSIKLKYIEY